MLSSAPPRPRSAPVDPEPAAAAVQLLEVDGMKCGGCVRAVEQRLRQQNGVRAASVNLLTRTAWVELERAVGCPLARFPGEKTSDVPALTPVTDDAETPVQE